MVLELDSILNYGRYYSDSCTVNENCTFWWFNLNDYCVYSTDVLLNKYDFSDYKAIVESNIYIPMFKTDIIILEKEYLSMRPKNENNEVLILEKKHKGGFDTAFKIFIEKHGLIRDWYDFERKKLYQDAVRWCCVNNIVFFKQHK